MVLSGDRQSLQENLCKVSDWSVKWEMLFNIDKCQILLVGARNIKNDYKMHIKIKSVRSVEDLDITVMSNLKFSQQCKSVIKANRIMGFIKRKFSFKNKDLVLPLYYSFVRSHLKYGVQFWSPHHAKVKVKLGAYAEATWCSSL